jgi:hypothetical protein
MRHGIGKLGGILSAQLPPKSKAKVSLVIKEYDGAGASYRYVWITNADANFLKLMTYGSGLVGWKVTAPANGSNPAINVTITEFQPIGVHTLGFSGSLGNFVSGRTFTITQP